MAREGVVSQATGTTVDVAWGAGAGLVFGLCRAIGGPLIGTIIGAIGAGMIHRKQADVIALLAGWSLFQGAGTASAQGNNNASRGVM